MQQANHLLEATFNSLYRLANNAEKMAICFVGGAFFGAGVSALTGPLLQSAAVGGSLGIFFWLFHH